MADYTPKYLHADQISSTASAAVTGGQTLMVSGSGTVAPAAADSGAVVGVAAHDAPSGGRVSYFPRGKVHISKATGAITAGDQVASAANGGVQALGAGENPIGIALTTAAADQSVEWMQL